MVGRSWSSGAFRATTAVSQSASRIDGISSSSSVSGATVLTRAAYVARIRRAFLLRVHPDRFRNQSQGVVQQQAQLVKALANRMTQPDFQAWQHQFRTMTTPLGDTTTTTRAGSASSSFPFSLEQRDGSLFQSQLNMDHSVEDILTAMVWALNQCGAGSTLPKESPAEMAAAASSPQHAGSEQWMQSSNNTNARSTTTTSAGLRPGGVDHRYDIVSNRGRSLATFLHHLDWEEVSQRKLARTDAQAAALAVRRLYSFQAVDATTLGWSSESVAVLLRRLLALHHEHHAKLNVDSFYPLRLVFTPDDFHETLDVYAGILRLSPSSTPLQWLEQMQLVTTEKREQLQMNRDIVQRCKSLIHSHWNVHVLKGFSCESRDFFEFLQRVCLLPPPATKQGDDSYALLPEAVYVKVEAAQACRRPIVTSEGTIRLGAGMNDEVIERALQTLAPQARIKRAESDRQKQECRSVANHMQRQLGVPRIYRTGVLSNQDFLDSLHRMQHTIFDKDASEEAQQVKLRLAGHTLGITGTGHFCHLGDDGSVVIPYDWR